MGFAGLWESWRAPEGDSLETFCILTMAANRFMATIHERMPVILSPADYSSWLSLDHNIMDTISRFFQPCPADSLTAVKVSTCVNSPSQSSEECIRPL